MYIPKNSYHKHQNTCVISVLTQRNLYLTEILILNEHVAFSLLHQLFPQTFGSLQTNREILHAVNNLLADLGG